MQEGIFILVLYLLMITDFDLTVPNISYLTPIIWSISIIVKIYKNNKLKQLISKSNTIIDSQNEKYYRLIPFLIGMITICASLSGILYNQNKLFFSLLILNGILLFISGYFYLSIEKIHKYKGKEITQTKTSMDKT